jgi:hypothetical protein
MHARQHRRPALLVTLAALLLAACSSGGSSGGGGTAPATTAAAAADRPSSTAKLSILAPRNGQTVPPEGAKLRLSLVGARIVDQTTTRLTPDTGHVHLQVDGKLVAMNYALSEQLPRLPPGQHVVQVEFVAADHLPFEPRVIRQAAFQVQP